MKIIIGTKREQIEMAGVQWVIFDTCTLHMEADGNRAVIEELNDEENRDCVVSDVN